MLHCAMPGVGGDGRTEVDSLSVRSCGWIRQRNGNGESAHQRTGGPKRVFSYLKEEGKYVSRLLLKLRSNQRVVSVVSARIKLGFGRRHGLRNRGGGSASANRRAIPWGSAVTSWAVDA